MQKKKWILPALIGAILQITATAQPFVKDDKGNYLRKGYTVVTSEPRLDTVIVVDPITGKEMTHTRLEDRPWKINGKKIYTTSEVSKQPGYNTGSKSLDEYIMNNIKDDLKSAPKGVVYIDFGDIIVDETGRIVYYAYHGLKIRTTDGTQRVLNDETIAPKIQKLLETAPTMKPAMLKGKKVGSFLPKGMLYDFKMEV